MRLIRMEDVESAIIDRADLPPLTTVSFITRLQMTRWINQSARSLMGMLIDAYGEGHFATSQEIETVADQQYSVLPPSGATESDFPHGQPTDMYRILFLRVTLDGTRVDLMRSTAEFVDMEDDNDTVAWTLAFPPRWHFREYLDQRFLWSRTPQGVFTVTVHYVPYFLFVDMEDPQEPLPLEFGDPSSEEHHMRAYNGWDEWVILDCAIKAMKRQDLPVETWQALLLEQQALEADIKAAAPKRTDEAKQIRRKFYRQDQLRRVGARWLTW